VTLTIERSEFARNSNGRTDGQTHNLYVGSIDRLRVSASFFHEARYGHNLKSRARESLVENSYLMDGPSGVSSYVADFSNGGQVTLRGNLLHKGPLAPNRVAIAYGAEGLASGGTHSLSLIHNTVVMTRPNSTFLRVPSGAQSVRLWANVLASPDSAELITGGFALASVSQQGNVSTQANGFSGADNIAAPNFWPAASVLGLLSLPAAVDAAYRQDSPQLFTLRTFTGSTRLSGALQSAP
jgi:hypothetical protein